MRRHSRQIRRRNRRFSFRDGRARHRWAVGLMAHDAGARQPPTPRRRPRLPPRSRLLDRNDHPGPLRSRRLHLRLRPPGKEPPFDSAEESAAVAEEQVREFAELAEERQFAALAEEFPYLAEVVGDMSPKLATTSRPRSSTASTSSSTRSRSATTRPDRRGGSAQLIRV
jgi:hypothetical protein